MNPPQVPIRASTQEHLDIEDIRDDIIILKDGGCALVLATTAVNFGLLSEKEQDATIYAYAALLNSLTFSLQIVIRSQKKDISSYLKKLSQLEEKTAKPEIKEQLAKYRQFIQETVAKNEVLDKKFYLVIPMTSLELGVTQALTSPLKRQKGLPFPKDYILEKAKISLHPKRDHLMRQLNRLGLKARQLKTAELIKLFFEAYNPSETSQPVNQAGARQATLVSTASSQAPKPIRVAPAQPNRLPTKETSFREQVNNLVKQAR